MLGDAIHASRLSVMLTKVSIHGRRPTGASQKLEFVDFRIKSGMTVQRVDAGEGEASINSGGCDCDDTT